MNLKHSISEAIAKRVSRRAFTAAVTDPALRSEISQFLLTCTTGPFNTPLRFRLMDLEKLSINEKIGSYGAISGTKSFLVGAVPRQGMHLEDFGYIFEKIILYLTDCSLATCWLAASFNRRDFTDAIDLKEGELIPAVSPLGYAAESLRFKEKLFTAVVQSRNRKPWDKLFFNQTYATPLLPSEAGVYHQVLEMVRLAPSAANNRSKK
ncbi:MAG: hypothetical protein JW795_17930 [Chitinivibrionales bacterium]|nr:hypothetical protein [Chitinivibrionales bacterium]